MEKSMIFLAQRLASFKPKRRRSSAVNSKMPALKWPHPEPSPESLAEAGFFFNATSESPDNVTCYLCQKSLDGWEAGDDAVAEHLRHSKDCGWALNAAIPAGTDPADYKDDPNGKLMTQARIQTFEAGVWPHEDEGKLTIQNMAQAGWVYTPSKESNDFTMCPYCGVSLDGWEPEDDPWDEHHRRALDCVFFAWKPKRGRAKRGSRASIQSNRSRRSESVSSTGDDRDDEDVPKPTKRGKKASTTKKTTTKRRGENKNVSSDRETSIEGALDAEDAPFEVKKGRKRPSSVAAPEPFVVYDGSKDTDEEDANEPQPPPPKKRITRQSIAAQRAADEEEDDSLLLYEDIEPPVPKKLPGKRGRPSNASKKTLQASARKVSKPRLPDDDEIDRALELDLERQLTDEEDFSNNKKPFIRSTKRTTRSRASLAVEEQMKGQPSGSLLLSAKQRRSKTPGAESEESARSPTKTPFKSFFRAEDQDFSMPVKISEHLTEEDNAGVVPKGLPTRGRAKGAESEASESGDATKPRPRKRGQKAKAVEVEPAEKEKPKPKRGRPPKAKAAPTNDMPVPAASERDADFVQEKAAKPKRGRKPKHANTNPEPRDSGISSTSTVPIGIPAKTTDAAEHGDFEVGEDEDAILDQDNVSDTDNAFHYRADIQQHQQDSVDESLEPAAPSVRQKGRRGGKAASLKKTQDIKPSRGKKAVVEETSEKEPEILAPADEATIMDETAVAEDTAPADEATHDAHPELSGMEVDQLEHKRLDTEESLLLEPTATNDVKKGVSFISPTPRNDDSPRGSDTEIDSPALEPSKSRMPLSPSRKQIKVPLASTPMKNSSTTKLATSKPWTAVDLDVVFLPHNGATEEDETAPELTEAEREMTVEEWVKWNAQRGEERLKAEAERMVTVFEREGDRAVETLNGISETTNSALAA